MSILIWIGIPSLVIILGIVAILCDKLYGWRATFIAVGSIVLIIITLSWAITYTTMLGDIKEFEAIRSTVAFARADVNISEYENVTLTVRIIKANTWLAKNQYWANMAALDIFYPDKISELDLIK